MTLWESCNIAPSLGIHVIFHDVVLNGLMPEVNEAILTYLGS
jgi:hypothetical protein